MATNAPLPKSRCPECDARIFFERMPDLGQILACPECGNSLEVIRLSPIELDWVGDDTGGDNKGGGFVDDLFFDRSARDEDTRDADYQADDDDDQGDW